MAVIAQSQLPVNIVYLDVNTVFGQSEYGILVANINAINNQLLNLFSSMLGEVDYEPTFGASLDNYVFDPNDTQTWAELRTDFWNAINVWMASRIYVNPNSFIFKPDMPNRIVYVSLSYTYLQLGVTVTATLAVPVATSSIPASQA